MAYTPRPALPAPTRFRQLRVADMIQVQIICGEEWRNLYAEYHPSDLAISRLCHELRGRGYRDDSELDDPNPISPNVFRYFGIGRTESPEPFARCNKPVMTQHCRMVCSLQVDHPGECMAV